MAAGAVFLIIFVFAWLLASIVTGVSALHWPVGIGASAAALAFFIAGHFYLKKNGPRDWEKLAQIPMRTPGMRIASRRSFEYAHAGVGILALLLAGPGWAEKIVHEWRSMIPPRREIAHRLESLRLNLAARDGWVPVNDFERHKDDLFLLTRLGMLAIRESAGRWYFHVTLEGAFRPASVQEKSQAGELSDDLEIEIEA